MRWTAVTGKLWKHALRNSVIFSNGADPSMLSPSSTRRITGRSGCVTGWAATRLQIGPPDGSTASTYLAQSQRVWLARK